MSGGRPEEQVYGVEIDAAVHERISAQLVAESALDPGHLILADFFGVDSAFGAIVKYLLSLLG